MSVEECLNRRGSVADCFFELSQGDVKPLGENSLDELGHDAQNQAFVISRLLEKVPKGPGTGDLRALKAAITADIKELDALGSKMNKVTARIRKHADDMFTELIEMEEG